MRSDELACPECHGALSPEGEGLGCSGCRLRFAMTLGIPTLSAELSRSGARLAKVVEAYPGASWEDLFRLLRPREGVPTDASAARRWSEKRIERHERFYAMFIERAREAWPLPRRGLALEIGCGRGDGLLALARDFEHVFGLDVSLASLVAARKLIEERGLQNVTLVHASAHGLPFKSGLFDHVQAINVIEHVFRPEHFFAEIRRVLAPSGIFCGDSRNRFDAFFPEPHVKLMWLGFLPRKWMEPYVRLRKGTGYTGTHLLSFFELERALAGNFGAQCRVVLPDVQVYVPRAPLALKRLVEKAHRQRTLERSLLPFFPTHIALAQG
jgi:SAM-dependent methyltransferase